MTNLAILSLHFSVPPLGGVMPKPLTGLQQLNTDIDLTIVFSIST